MKKKLFAAAAVLLTVLLIVPASAAAKSSAKEEVIYGILNTDGSVKNLYAVNIFTDKDITDYGNYKEIKNLTNADKINYKNDEITIKSSSEMFYYQGTLTNAALPWNIKITYKLDGKNISTEELAGKSGNLDIAIFITKNTEANSVFFDNYALQTTVTLDSDICSNIKADNAVIAEAGGKKQISATFLPGSGGNITVSADVKKFEMDSISVNAIKMALDVNINHDEFSNELSLLKKAASSLDDGAIGLLAGMEQFCAGMKEYSNGLKAYSEGLGELNDGVGELAYGAAGITQGLFELAAQNKSLTDAANAIQQKAFDEANSIIASMGLELPVLTPQNYIEILEALPQFAELKKQLDSAVQFTQGIIGYTSGVAALYDGAEDLSDGAADLKDNISNIFAGANDLYDSAEKLYLAADNLKKGIAEYRQGTKQFRSSTAGIDDTIDEMIDEMLEGITGGSECVSFVSEKNTNVENVQFVLKTDPIEYNEPENNDKAVETKPLTFWQKFLKLFGLYKET